MPIALAKKFTSLLDEVYKNSSVTSDLTSDGALIRAGANANEIIYPQIDVSGLGDYSRNSGYTSGAVNLAWKTTAFNYDRGTKISIDAMDDEETIGLAFGQAGATLQREKVAPEADAFFFATLASKAGISKVQETYASAEAFLMALLAAKNKLDEDEVPEENRYLYATPTLLNGVMALDTTKSREILAHWAKRTATPQTRFYTAIDLLDGRTADEEAGHFRKSAGAFDLNFMIIHKSAIIKYDKHVVGSVISPDANQNADAYILKYRKYGIVDAYANKLAGIYASYKAAEEEGA
ncbi:MAG: hypothetical protein LBP79_01245 [Clostridiales bacterium]|jgi:hypothetical protein|nr:hypothetical protein [Clostridiales bacterium]